MYVNIHGRQIHPKYRKLTYIKKQKHAYTHYHVMQTHFRVLQNNFHFDLIYAHISVSRAVSDRKFQSQSGRIGNARTTEELLSEEQSMRHISSVFTYPLTVSTIAMHYVYQQAV
jgi:hypothetical protein